MKELSIKIVHRTQNRMRVKYLGRDEATFKKLIRLSKTCPYSENTSENLYTRSLLITHQNNSSSILDWFHDNGVDLVRTPAVAAKESTSSFEPKLKAKIQQKINSLDQTIRDWSGNELNLEVVTAFSLIGMSIFQTFKRNKFLPAGESLLASGLKIMLKDSE